MTLEERVYALEARLDILQLEAVYARTWDTADAPGWAGVFTADGAFVLTGKDGAPDRRFEGHDALARFCAGVNRRYTGLHFMHTPEVHIAGDTARGRMYFEFKYVVRADPASTSQGAESGYYDVEYARTPDGWRMRERVEHGVLSRIATFLDL